MMHDAKTINREIGIGITANYRPKRNCRPINASNGRNFIELDRATQFKSRRFRTRKPKIVNVCHLLVVLAVFNFSSVGYAVLIMNSADDPISESKAIEGMVIYHFTGSILIVGGFLADNLLIKKEIKRDS